MTVREEINAKKRSVMRIVMIGSIVFAAGFALNLIVPGLGVLGLPGFAVAFVTMAYAYTFAFRCPNCHTNWSGLAMQSGGSTFAVNNRIKCCPYCGLELDSKVTPSKHLGESDLDA